MYMYFNFIFLWSVFTCIYIHIVKWQKCRLHLHEAKGILAEVKECLPLVLVSVHGKWRLASGYKVAFHHLAHWHAPWPCTQCIIFYCSILPPGPQTESITAFSSSSFRFRFWNCGALSREHLSIRVHFSRGHLCCFWCGRNTCSREDQIYEERWV